MDRSLETVAVATICPKKMIISDEPLHGGREECETVRKGKCARPKLVAHTLHGNFDVKNENVQQTTSFFQALSRCE
jgi:hypothetical protein